ncbi:alpha/beta fold hydrolase [Candidatus Contubernalis alkalaceticus]|nr:alpha/beta fold hydrolase [Candidatus Contubernalis alkalaceticus]
MMLAVTALSCGSDTKVDDPPLEGEITDLAEDFVNKMAAGEFERVVDYYFDAPMKRAMSAKTLSETWETLLGQVGSYTGQVDKGTDVVNGYDVVFVTTQFENDKIVIQVVFNEDKRISGLWFLPAEGVDDSSYSTPSYVQPGLFSESEVVIGTDPWDLPGTLSVPGGSGPFPAVVLVHGSGPQDRDEAIGPNKPFKDLAQGLASQGIAVLRYEKRTKEHAHKLVGQTDILTIWEETAEDALEAVSLLRNTENIDPSQIYILGHSLGATAAPRIGDEGPDIAGLILLAGAARPLEDLILEQVTYLTYLDGPPAPEMEEELKKIEEQVTRVKDPALSPDTSPQDLPLEIPAAYWLDLRDYNPPQMAKELSMPLLILQGERDYQVTMEDFEVWQETLLSREDVVFKSYPGLNHLFIEGQGKSTPEEYFQPGNVSKEVVDDIASWIIPK